MTEDNNFINFFFIKKNIFLIDSFLKSNLTCLYQNELILDNYESNSITDKIKKFLDDNIYKIEKLNNQFIKNINLVIYDERFLPVNISIKKNVSGILYFEKERLNLLSKIKNEIELNYKELSIIHFLVNNNLIDSKGIDFRKNEDPIVCKSLSIEITFILFPLLDIFKYQKIFADYQISVNKIISGEHLKDLSLLEEVNELEMALNIFLGNNPKEVILLSKKFKKEGIFEKFFHLFG